MLHLVNKSPYESACMDSVDKYAHKGSPILLFEDGVYAAIAGAAFESRIKKIMGDHEVYVLKEDLAARGIADRMVDGVKEVDYAGFVDLAEQNKTVSWS
ncbi:protein TusB [bacterium BMS3Abin01]|nr:protein TusB [bacterium BMS3Abin01]HDY69574.1 sulfurtransferase complex subunit TusB [Actinomycetota bacterium]